MERIIKQILKLHELVDFQMYTRVDADKCKTFSIPEIIFSPGVTDSDRFLDNIKHWNLILPQRSTQFWKIDSTPIVRKVLVLGSVNSILEVSIEAATPVTYASNQDTVFIQCNLKSSVVRSKGTNSNSFQSSNDLTEHLEKFPASGKQGNMVYYQIPCDFEDG
ncbi:hypothetical protein BJ322DRAFT_1105473 [Thelephora terrestris]|uniref:Uncharacterized protein n=1 Tax=Thelephora terrestris TaxID=56493 RepID=A0A9P6LAL2_9AGAM|nr:hypothetical protein BJ322DRAFT_1105473 [Thelephora terrestris]